MSDINLPAHLNEVLETMSHEMGVPRDALVSQAVYMLARLNGFVVAGKVSGGAPSAATAQRPAGPAGLKKRPPEPEPEPEPEADAPAEDEEGNPFDQPADEPLEQAEDAPPEEEPPPEEEEPEPPPPARGGKGPVMVLSMAGRDPYKMASDQAVLGRGKHCDFVIESNRVSREHARFSKKGSDFFVEDLGSSNGTFMGPGKEKLTAPKKLKDGDEITFGTEKVKVAIKK